MQDNPFAPVKINCNPTDKYKTANRQFQGIPGIEVSPSGKIWATWYSGGVNEGPDNFVLLVNSKDNGETWTEPVATVDPPGNVRAYDPLLWHDPKGRMWWFWAQSYSMDRERIHDGRGGVWGVFTENSDVERPVFSEPVRIANGVMMNKPVVLYSGEWALPVAVWEYTDKTFMPRLNELNDERFSKIIVSRDEGKTFESRGCANVPHRSFDEHMVVELRDGRLWMLVRTFYGIGQSFSSDKGRTWSLGKNSGLGGPNARFFIRRLSSGNLLLVNHADASPETAVNLFIEGNTWRKRSHLTAFISADEGKTWTGSLLLDERDGVSYPDGVEDKEGVIRIIYDYERHKEGSIFMASFKEEDVFAGKCVSKNARLRIQVNKTGGVKQ
jgi:hypothetical protein